MNEIDFQTALGRLLRDSVLREEFARDPSAVAARLKVRDHEREPFVVLSIEEVEVQATILIRKRFDAMRRLIPATMERLGDRAWALFLSHALHYWPEAPGAEISDAEQFCVHLSEIEPHALCAAEMNRVRFRLKRRPIALYLVRSLPLHGKLRPALQVFIRHGQGWSEYALHFALG